MANTSVIRVAGPTYALSITASSHTAVTINDSTNDQVNYAAFLNLGTVAVAINLSALWNASAPAAAAATLPVDGTPGSYVLPPLMTFPIVLAVPTTPFSMTAIGASAGPSLVYVTPVADQS